jgi:hypothetical protein
VVCSLNWKRVGVSLLVMATVYSAITIVPAHAQVTGATISGTVADSSGRVIPNAKVSITNVATGISREITSNTDGFYSAPNLQAGTYTVKVTMEGFRTEEKTGIVLTVGAAPVLDVTMQVGTAKEVVQVQTEAPAVQLASSDISAVVNATTVRELPLNGRSWTDLASLQPGVDTIHTQPDFSSGTDRGNRGFGQQLTISGARPQQNNYRLDGVSINDYSNGAPGSVLGGALGVDAIQEFSVLTSNYSAEYGKTSGGVVNAITRSGTNDWHGSAYEFLRNSALDARNYFDGSSVPPFKRNQFGGALGGPIIKNHTFFFADYEGIRQSTGITNVTLVPSQAARNGLLCSNPPGPDPQNPCTPTQLPPGPHTNSNGVDLSAAQYFAFYHLPNQGITGNGDLGFYDFVGQQIVNENFLTTRVDHKFSEKDSLFGTYLFDHTPYSSPDGLNNVEFTTKTSRQIFALEETHTFTPTFVNSVRFGLNQELVDNNKSLTAINPAASDTSLGSFLGRNAAQVLMTGGANDFTGGVGGSPTYLYRWHSFQLYDDAFYTRGTHSIRFGVAAEREMLNQVSDTDPNGIWNFGSLQDFLQGNPSKFQGGIPSTITPRNFRQTIFGAYIQDDWRWRSNLTLNLGLRYEMSTVPFETSGRTANLRNFSDAQPVCGALVSGCGAAGSFFNNPTLRNFEPRIGFAWDPFHNGKTAVRGGAGIFDVLPLIYQFLLMANQATPFFSYTSIKGATALDNYCQCTNPFYTLGGFQAAQDFPGNTLRQTYIPFNPKRNYVAQWNLNIQQQITPTLAAMVAYVGSRGIHQPFRADEINEALPTKTRYGYVFPQVDVLGNLYSVANGCTQTDPNGSDPLQCVPPNPINQNFGSIRSLIYEGHSYYNAFEAQLAKRLSRGFQVQGTFTWSKSIDTGSATIAGDSFGNSISSLPWFDLSLDRGLSDFNVGRTLVVNGTWELPTPKYQSALAQHALGGWELGLIFTASDGVPFTPTWGTGSDPQNSLSGDDWAFVNRAGGPGCNNPINSGNVNGYIKTQCFAVPTAPNQAFFNQYCDPAPPSLGGPLAPGDLRCFNLHGNAGRNVIIGPGVTEMDFSVFKNNYIKSVSERFNIQFRAELFNILNHANFGLPITPTATDIFDGTGALSNGVGQITKTTTSSRQIQFAVKIIF